MDIIRADRSISLPARLAGQARLCRCRRYNAWPQPAPLAILIPMSIHTLLNLIPPAGVTDRFEKMRACAGALFGLTLTGVASLTLLGTSPGAIWLIAPMGASAVLLFAVPASPLAQPWSILGGNVVAALIGVTCAKVIGVPVLAAAVACALAIGAMSLLRCLHPPSGAVALTAVLGGPVVHAMGYEFVLLPVALNSVLLLVTALFFNNATGRRYPHWALHAAPVVTPASAVPESPRIGITAQDLDIVLARYNQVLDVSRDDLQAILLETERQVYLRHYGVTCCADVMSLSVECVEFGTSLGAAWDLLQLHRLPVLPVVDRSRRVIGIVSQSDFLRHARLDGHASLAERLAHLLKASLRSHSNKPEVAGQIMRKDVLLARTDQTVIELAQIMTAAGVYAMPVIDSSARLAGLVTQANLVTALYAHNLRALATPGAGTQDDMAQRA